VATALSLVAFAPPSFAQAPNLTGESLEALPLLGTLTLTNVVCDKQGTSTIGFEATGLALGPYAGTFVETGTITIGPQTNLMLATFGAGPILDFDSTFTIDSDAPAGTVTGTKSLSSSAPTEAVIEAFGRCDPDGSSSPEIFAAAAGPLIEYDAQINVVTGSRTDSGTGSFVAQTTPLDAAGPFFQQVFNSDQPVPPGECEDRHEHNGQGVGHDEHGNGLGKGHLKHCLQQ
jgi:hypothetical protein